jgi:hypothetical protein
MIRTNYEALEIRTEFLNDAKINLVYPRAKNYVGWRV